MLTRFASIAFTFGLVVVMPGGMAHASGMVLEDGYRTPRTMVLEDGGFLTPISDDEGFDARIERVRQTLLTAASDAKCAPQPYQRRFQRRLRAIARVLGRTVDASAEQTTAALHKAAVLNRIYCGGVDHAADVLDAECTLLLRAVCPRLAN